MKTTDESVQRRHDCALAAAIIAIVFAGFAAPFFAFADGPLFTESFEAYEAGSNLRGQGGWDGLTNQGTVSEMPVTAGELLATGKALNTRAIQQADRIHQIGHSLPVFSADVVTTLSVEAYALADSINTGIGIGGNPVPGPEMGTSEGFFATYRAGWYSTAQGWAFDLRGIAGVSEANIFYFSIGLGEPVTLQIIVDGPARLIYGQLNDGAVTTTPSRAISAGQIGELDALAIFSDRSLSNRLGIELDDIELTSGIGENPRPCGDVNASGELTVTDALAVLQAAIGRDLVLQCEPEGRPLQTGQTACFDGLGAGISCVGSGQDGEYQYGVARTFTDNGDGTISDEATGLMWEKLADDGSIHDFDDVYTWPQAFSGKIATLNSTVFAGYGDWRVPNLAEVQTLSNFAVADPAALVPFDTACTPGCLVTTCSCTPSAPFWTSTTFVATTELAWADSFTEGSPAPADKTQNSYHVRAVRGGY